jgi:hypothetical protein
VASTFLLAAVATIVPALGLLFYLLNRYEGYFEDARVFFALIVGFFAGLVVAFLEAVAFRFDSPEFIAEAGPVTAFLLFMGGYALVESAAKTTVLGTSKFRKRKDTPYYGAALGIGFGAMVALQTVARRFQDITTIGWALDGPTVLVVLLTLAFAVSTLMVQAGSGILVGRGAAEGRLFRGLAHGALAQMPAFAFLWYGLVTDVAFIVTAAVLSLGYGLALVFWTRRILDRIVPPEIRDQVLKERRREARREERAAQSEVATPTTDAKAANPASDDRHGDL